MVAKPDAHGPVRQRATPQGGHGLDEARLDRDPLSLPICLEFGPVLKVLAEAGYVGERLNEWLVQFNEANKDAVGKLELDAEGRLLVSPMPGRAGSLSEVTVFGELYLWTREHGGEAHGSRLGVELPNGARYAPRRGLAVPGATCRLFAFGRDLAAAFLPPLRGGDNVAQRPAGGGPAQDGRLHRPRRAAGLAH